MEWQEEQNKLYKKFKFRNFVQAMLFMAKAVEPIEKLNHHPEWKNAYNGVEVWLCTHSEGNIVTEKDRKLAEILDGIYDAMGSSISDPGVH